MIAGNPPTPAGRRGCKVPHDARFRACGRSSDIGGYTLGFVNNDAYPNGAKTLQAMWLGATYPFSKHLDLTSAWYHYDDSAVGSASKRTVGSKGRPPDQSV